MHVSKLFDLTGKVAIVTGGSRGLGKEMALALGQAGANLVISARREEWLLPAAQEMQRDGLDVVPVTSDIGTQDGVQAVLAAALHKWGRVDILVNNAGVTWGAPPAEMPLDKWDAIMNTNAKGVLMGCQAVFAEMKRNDSGGSIVNVASTTGHLAVDPRVMQAIGYQASKAAVIMITRQLAVEWAPYGIRVNAIAPFVFTTRMTKAVIERAEEYVVERVPMGRVGRPEELKGTVVFLASEASSYITGQVIDVDGGMSAW